MINKQFIIDNLFTKNGSINNRIYDASWWNNRNFHSEYDWLMNTYDLRGPIFQKLYHIYHGLSTKIVSCKCGKPLKFQQFKSGYLPYCSLKCNSERTKKIIANRNMNEIVEKMKETNLKRYGVKYTTQSSTMIDKTRQTKLKRYGSETYNNSTQAHTTNLERYGVKHTFQQQHVVDRIHQYGIKGIMPTADNLYLLNVEQKMTVNEIANHFEVTPKTVRDWAKKLNVDLVTYIPDYMKLQNEFTSKLPKGYIVNDRKVIYPKELDIYYPDHKLAIEVNGLYWHANDKARHLEKTKLCSEKGIHLLHFWEHEINSKLEIVLSIINNKLGLANKLHARKCVILQIDNNTYRKFLNENHLQGYHPSKIRYGMFHNDVLVSVIGFGKPRFDKTADLEIIRYATLLNTTVVGGLSKFLKLVNDKTLVTYADRRLFDGSGYAKAGFTKIRDTKPGYFWYQKTITLSRYQTQKHKLAFVLGELFDHSKSENDNMVSAGYSKVYDCGQTVWVMNIE